MIRAKEAVEAENADIKMRLASVISMLQPLVASSPAGQSVAEPSLNQSFLPVTTATTPASHGASSNALLTNATSAPTATTISTPSSTASPPVSTDPYVASNGNANSQNQWNSAAYRAQLDQQRHDLAHGLELGTERLGLEFLLDQNKGATGPGTPTSSSNNNNNNNSKVVHHPPSLGTPTHETTGYRPPSHPTNMSPHPNPHSPYSPNHIRIDPATTVREAALQNNIDPALQSAIDPALSGSNGHSTSTIIGVSNNNDNDTSTTTTASSSSSSSPPQHAIPIKNCAPTCPLDNLLLDFLQERRQRAAEGFPTQEIIGPRYPSISSLLNPLKESHPLSKVFIEILHTFPTISQLPERVAVLYIMFLIMRWQIHPSQDNYDRLPDFVRPSPVQLCHSHPAWLDHLPFPAMRDRLIKDYAPPEVFPFESFFVPFTTTLSLNWPYEDTDTLLQGPMETEGELMINPVFERHLRRFENWTLGEAFARALPMLDGTYNLRTDSEVAGGTGSSNGKGSGASRGNSRA